MFKSSSLSVSRDDIAQLYGMLATMRPAGSLTERRFIRHYLQPLGVERDGYGNLFKRIGDLPVSWSCHLDTVHKDGGMQTLVLKDKHIIKLHKEETSNCLGADDTAGVWLMAQMIQAERPGLYVFHREEERGGKGSRWAAAHNKKLFDGIDCMIALDRRGTDSVITRQSGGRCCSDDFGKSLADKLNKEISGLFKYRLDTGGSFTDSASYTDLIAECSNLSVGYYSQHWKDEHLDLNHLLMLRRALLDVDFRGLTIKRKPGEKEKHESRWGSNYYGKYDGGEPYGGRQQGYWENGKWISFGKHAVNCVCTDCIGEGKRVKALPLPYKEVFYRIINGKKVPDTLLALIQDYPVQVAAMLDDWGFGVEFLRGEISDRLGAKRVVRGGKAYTQVEENDNREGPEGLPF